MNTKLMTGVAAIALVLPALVLETTAVQARAARGGGHAVSHASAPARVSRPSVSHAVAVRPSASHANVAHARPSHSIHTQAARPMEMIKRVGPNAHVVATLAQHAQSSIDQKAHAVSSLAQHAQTSIDQKAHDLSAAAQQAHTSNGNVIPLSSQKPNANLPAFTARSATLTGGNANFPHPAVGPEKGSLAQQITDAMNRSSADKAKAIDATKRASDYKAEAAQQTQDAQTDRAKGQQMFNAAQAADKAGNHGNALSLYKSSAEAFGAANTADNNAKFFNADAAGQTKRAGLENLLSKVAQDKANSLANGGSGTDTPKTKGSGSGTDTPKTKGSGSGTDTPKTKGSGSGTDTPKTKGSGSGTDTPKKTGGGSTTDTTDNGQGAGASQTGNGDVIGNGNKITINNKIDDRHRGRGVGGSGSGDTGSAGSGSASSAASSGGSTGGGSAGASGGAASAGSSTTAPATAATTGSADTTATQAANPQSQCLVKITLPDNRVLFKDVCTGQSAATPPVAQPVQAEAQQQ